MLLLKESQDLKSKEKDSNTETFLIIECTESVCNRRQKATFTKVEATDRTDALLKFKALRHINKLPYHTILIPESEVSYYPQGV